MKTLIINDFHLGVKRAGGTTPDSRIALDKYMLEKFGELLKIPHDYLIILGDLCDSRHISEHTIRDVVKILRNEFCTIVLGNHCLKGIEDHTISSCELIGDLGGHQVIKELTNWKSNIWILPHVFNQEIFDEAIQQVPDAAILLTHCNIDSPFSTGDHSLNLSMEQIKDLHERGVKVIGAHEHARRDYEGVTIPGNQFPSSISDALHGDKFCITLEDGNLEFHKTWDQADHYTELDYSDIKETGKDFVRINGQCTPAEYPGIVREVNELRKGSDSFIIANNVEVVTEGHDLNKEEVTNFNIIELLLEQIDKEYIEEVKSCV